jgi:hypothetical protein
MAEIRRWLGNAGNSSDSLAKDKNLANGSEALAMAQIRWQRTLDISTTFVLYVRLVVSCF